MPKIHALDSITIHKIAAGEVIDRPASIVKELIENSLDSGATRIIVEAHNGGKLYLKVTDNGCGISKEDLPLAPLPHTTSKLTSIEELSTLSSFGFRGEALASICHVADLTITSKTQPDQAYVIHAHQNHISDPQLTAHQDGTSIEVKDLFFNIPVRQKFLKSDATEISYIYDVVLQAALIIPEVEFVLSHNGKELINSTGLSTHVHRITKFFGKEFAPKLLPFDVVINTVRFQGVLGDPTLTFSNRSKQVLSVNKRLIKSALLQKAIQLGFKDLIPSDRFPLMILDISLDASLVDVNIHPQKQEVKFLETGRVFEAIPKVIHQCFNQHLSPPPPEKSSLPINNFAYISSPSTMGINPLGAMTHHVSEPYTAPTYTYPTFQAADFSPKTNTASALFSPETFREVQAETFEYLQVYDTYLIVKTGQGTWILDQHAVHERVLYEKFKTQSRATHPPIQPLLISEVVDLTPDLFEIYKQEKEKLDNLGIETEEFGLQQVIIRGVPEVFTQTDMREWILSFLGQFKEGSLTPDKILLQKDDLQMMACKAAIKAGKKMSLAETKALIQDFLLSPSHYTCPHGRPLFIPLGKTELEKLFLRR